MQKPLVHKRTKPLLGFLCRLTLLYHSSCISFFALFIEFSAAFAAPHETTLMLLDAPINATWAANHAETWREKGFSGFLFQGILDDFSPYPSELEQDAQSDGENGLETTTEIVPGNWEALLEEIKGSTNRLKAAGIEHNFLRITLGPEADYFNDKTLNSIAEQRLRLAGEFCRQTGLRGIALDTQAQNGMFDFRWDGYPIDASTEMLRKGAQRFGTRLIRAFVRAYPEGNILLIAEHVETASPLWYSFFEGALDSAKGAEQVSIQLALYDGGMPNEPGQYREQKEQLNRLFRRIISPAARSTWERQCGITFSLEPVRYVKDIPTARYPLNKYRHALYAAAVNGNAYTIITAPEGGWWHIPPDIAEQFGQLRQGGRARVSFAPPVPTPLDVYAPRLAIANALHLGQISIGDQTAAVLQQDQKTMLLAWSGIPEDLKIPGRTGIITVTDLIDGKQQYFTATEDNIIIPAMQGLLLVENLPPDQFALPACMTMQLSDPISAGITRSNVKIEVYNPLLSPLTGLITLSAPSRYSLGASLMEVGADVGKAFAVERTIQGLSTLGQSVTLTMHLHMDVKTPVTRTFCFPVQPQEFFYTQMDGPVYGPPVLLPPTKTTNSMLAAVDTRGGVVCMDAVTGREEWRKSIRGTYTQPPLALIGDDGEAFTAVQNNTGTIRIFDRSGTEKAVIYPGNTAYHQATTYRQEAEKSTTHLAVAATDGTVALHASTGTLLKRFVLADIIYISSHTALPGALLVIEKSEDDGPDAIVIKCLNLSDDCVLWETTLPEPLACPPTILPPHNGKEPSICLLRTSGNLSLRNSIDGNLLTEITVKTGSAATLLAAIDDITGNYGFIAIADNTVLALYEAGDADITLIWERQLPDITTLASLPDGRGVAAGLKGGGIYAFSASGNPVWEEHRSSGAVTGLLFYNTPKEKDGYSCVITSESGELRGLKISKEMLLPENR